MEVRFPKVPLRSKIIETFPLPGKHESKLQPMTRIKISKDFYIDEFVPKSIYDAFGAKARWYINPTTVEIAQFVRDHFGKAVTINNWATGGQYQERGYRVPSTTNGAKYSQHKLGNAVDFSIAGMTSKQIYDYIMAHEELFIQVGVTTMENVEYTKTWNHLDARNTGDESKILIVNP